MAKYKGTVNMPATHVFKTGDILNGTQTIWRNRYQNFPVKIGNVEDIIAQFSPYYFSTDTGRAHPYYWSHWNSNDTARFDFNNANITFLVGDNSAGNLGLDNDANPKKIWTQGSPVVRSYEVDRDQYGLVYPTTAGSSGRQYGYAAHGIYQNHNVENNNTAIMTNVIKYIKAQTVNSDGIHGITPIEDRGGLLVPNPTELGMYYKEYQSGALEGASMGTTSQSDTLWINSYTDATLGDFNAGFQTWPRFSYVRYKKRSDGTYTQFNVMPVGPYDIWLYGDTSGGVFHTIYHLHSNPCAAFAFLRDNNGDIWILTINIQSEGGTMNQMGVTVPWYSAGNNITMLLYKVKDLPIYGSGNVTMVDITPTDTWNINGTLSYVDDTVYDINATFQELLSIEEDEGGGGDEPGDDPWEDVAESETGGGEGTFNWDNTPLETVSVEEPNVIGSSLMHVYRMDKYDPNASYAQNVQDALGYLSGFLWSNDLKTAIRDSYDSAKGCIVSIHELPFEVSYGSSYPVVLGNVTYTITGTDPHTFDLPRVVSQFQTVNLGTLTIAEKWGGYPDYAPHTQIQIFLPFIGYKALNVNEVMGKTLKLEYTFDVLTGECVAILYIQDGNNWYNAYQWNGQCALSYPISGAQYTQKLAALGQMVGGAVNAAVGFATMQDFKALKGIAQIGKGFIQGQQHQVIKEGSLGGSPGWMGGKQPFVTIESPRISQAKKKIAIQGDKVNRSMKVSECSGFTVFDTIHLESIHATKEEKELLEQMLTGGVIL